MSSSLKTRVMTAIIALPIIICSIVFLPYMDHLAFAFIIIGVNAIGTWELHNNILKKKIDLPLNLISHNLLSIVLVKSQSMLSKSFLFFFTSEYAVGANSSFLLDYIMCVCGKFL